MGVAKTRLARDLTVKQLVQDLAAEWQDDNEWHVLELVGELLEKHHARHRDLFACYRLEIEAAGEEPGTTLELQVGGSISSDLRRMATKAKAREDPEARIDWNDPKAQITVYVEELLHPSVDAPLLHQIRQLLPKAPTLLNQFLVPVGEVSVRKKSVLHALSDERLSVPDDWTGTGFTKEANRTHIAQITL